MKCLSADGMITRLNQDSIEVEVKNSSACSSCENKSNCRLGAESSKRNLKIYLNHPEEYKEGEIVLVKSLQKNVYKAIIFAYLLPCALLIMAITCFVISGIEEGLSVLFSLLLLMGYFGILSFFKAYFKKTISFFIEKKEL